MTTYRLRELPFDPLPLVRMFPKRDRSVTAPSAPSHLYAPPTTALSTPALPSPKSPPPAPPPTPNLEGYALKASAELPTRCPPSPFALATAFDQSQISPPSIHSANSKVGTDPALAEPLPPVDPINHIHAWLSGVPAETADPLSRNPSILKGRRKQVPPVQLGDRDDDSFKELASAKDEDPDPDLSKATSNMEPLKPTTPDSASFACTEARARIEIFKRRADYQEYLQGKDLLSSFLGPLATKSLKERIEFFESLQTRIVREAIADFEATAIYKGFLADLKMVEVYEGDSLAGAG